MDESMKVDKEKTKGMLPLLVSCLGKMGQNKLRKANGLFSGQQEIDGKACHGQKWLHNGISPVGRTLSEHSTGGSYSMRLLLAQNHTVKVNHAG